MSKKEPKFVGLPYSTKLEVIRISPDKKEVICKEMSLEKWNKLDKQPNYEYHAYQKGFHQFKLTK